MYLSLNWLKDLVNIPKSTTPEELGAKLTNHTVEVEKIEKQSARFDKVVVGKVLEVKKHPNSDHLNLTRVDVGEKEPLGIVCGAPNVSAGQLVPVALIGAELPNGMKIEEREVRGEKSQGMICAEDELGLGNEHAGIMVLDKKAKIGEPFGKYLKLDDVIFEVDNKSLSNRPDLWGHLGMAREIAAILEEKTSKEFKHFAEAKIKADEKLEKISVRVEEADLCPRYLAVKIDGVEVKDSPVWMQKRLTAVGLRPINNIVDATNYVMLELGQPMHAFDSNIVKEIIVRRADKDEKIKTLDGAERILDNSMLVIADKEKAIAIAGVMGSEASEIGPTTKSIILEAANFDAASIRKTSTKLNLRTEASMRFEKSLDPENCEPALARCLELIRETCPGAKVASQVVDTRKNKAVVKTIDLDLPWVAARLGEDIGKKRIVKILESLGFGAENGNNHVLKIVIPSWRAAKDVSVREDILEEIARIFGFNNIKVSVPSLEMKAPEINEERKLERRIKNLLSVGAAATEVYNYSFVSEEKMNKLKLPIRGLIKLANPLSSALTHLRAELFPNLLDNVRSNQAKYEKLSFFEIGSVFADVPGTFKKNKSAGECLPFEEKHLVLLVAGDSPREVYAKVKGQFEYLLKSLDFPVWRFDAPLSGQALEWAEKGSYANIFVNGQELGFAGLIANDVVSGLGLKKRVAVLEISFTKLFSLFRALPAKQYERPNKFPALERDLAFVVSEKILYGDVKSEIEKFDSLINGVKLFDIYEGGKLGEGFKNLAFHIDYESPERTLTAAEVDELQKKLIAHLKEKFEAQIRDF